MVRRWTVFAPWPLFGALWRHWGALGPLFGALVSLLASTWGGFQLSFSRFFRKLRPLDFCRCSAAKLLVLPSRGLPWALFGRSWAPLAPLGGPLGALVAPLGPLGPPLGCPKGPKREVVRVSGGVLETSWARPVRQRGPWSHFYRFWDPPG